MSMLPDAAVLTAHGSVLPGGFHIHVVERGLPDHVVSPCELQTLVCLLPWRQEEVKMAGVINTHVIS